MVKPNIGDWFPAGAVGDASPEDVREDRVFTSEKSGVGVKGTMPIHMPIIKNLTNQGDEYHISRGFHYGSGTVKTNITNLVPENIKKDINVGGVVGSLDGYIIKIIQNQTISPIGGTKIENIGFRPIQLFIFGRVGWFSSYDYNFYGFPDFTGGVAAGELLNQRIVYKRSDPFKEDSGELWADIRMIDVTNDSCVIKTIDYGGTSGKITSGVSGIYRATIFILGKL